MTTRDDLCTWATEDKELRRAYAAGAVDWSEVATADAEHAEKLKRLIKRDGWAAVFNSRTSRAAAWLIVQHAPHDIEFQRECLDEWLRRRDPSSDWQVALLTDRVALLEGRPQTYGTQLQKGSDGSWRLWPVVARSVEELDTLRGEMGLPSFRADYKALTGQEWPGEELPRAA
jgi:hypothetical protein